jgi:ATP-dependent DNA helicase PIF1
MMPHIVHPSEQDRLSTLSTQLKQLDAQRAEVLEQMHALLPQEAPNNHGKPWTAAEREQVVALFERGIPVKQIAEKHGRTYGSIRSELIRQGAIEVEAIDAPAPPQKQPRPPISAPKSTTGHCSITPEFAQAFELLENTQCNVFLTGKAGTGKSTFLHYFREHTRKSIAVVAPTGVAALNVGAQTIHSFFRFKFGFVDVKALKPSRTRVLRNLELLIIDEISMVRADVFDGIDRLLKMARKNDAPFGGVQVCVIGDLFQLPPVITREEKTVYSQFYPSPFFFCTQAYREGNFTTIQFSTIHRQNDAAFIQILNAIRAGTCDAAALEVLNQRLNPKAVPAPGTLLLTTTNSLAEDINSQKLAAMQGVARRYVGRTEGDFGVQTARLPAPELLVLKVGAQVMFVKNDSDGRWVNGSIGMVQKIADDSIIVRIGEVDHEVEPEEWKSLGYEVSKETGDIVEKTLGTYTQFPLTLAWAITIHKSQGKTLERVIIDLGNGAFAAGQLYVALSRCKSLAGIALKQPVTLNDIRCDSEVVDFLQSLSN